MLLSNHKRQSGLPWNTHSFSGESLWVNHMPPPPYLYHQSCWIPSRAPTFSSTSLLRSSTLKVPPCRNSSTKRTLLDSRRNVAKCWGPRPTALSTSWRKTKLWERVNVQRKERGRESERERESVLGCPVISKFKVSNCFSTTSWKYFQKKMIYKG